MSPIEIEQWQVFAFECIRQMADTKVEFTAASITFLCGYPDPSHTPNAINNNIGAVFAKAKTEGIIRQCGWQPSSSPYRKGGVVRVWTGA